MLTIIVYVALAAFGAGIYYGGLVGALTGTVAAVGIGSALAILFGSKGTGVALSGPQNTAQRWGGAVAAILCGVGAVHGGWTWGWAWGLGGYVMGMGATLLLAPVFALRESSRVLEAGETSLGLVQSEAGGKSFPVVPIDEFMAQTSGGRPNQMDMSPYEGSSFDCACGGRHEFRTMEVEVLRELDGMRLVFSCPDSDALTCVRVKGLLRFEGFLSLFGTRG